jgi:hypothetical protein
MDLPQNGNTLPPGQFDARARQPWCCESRARAARDFRSRPCSSTAGRSCSRCRVVGAVLKPGEQVAAYSDRQHPQAAAAFEFK